MITEETITLRRQTPTPPNDWLYEDKEGKRDFFKDIYLGKYQDPFPECTDEEKVQWEEEHKEPSPDPEVSDAPADPADPANEGKEAEV